MFFLLGITLITLLIFYKDNSIFAMNSDYKNDIDILVDKLPSLPKEWNGEYSVLELKDAKFNWRQMEWWAFFLEHKMKEFLSADFSFPGDRYGRVAFDLKRNINWDIKGSVAFNYDENIILNDKLAMDYSITEHGLHGEIIALFEPDFDDDGAFKEWHSNLKGGKSKYEVERENRTANSRRRKKNVKLVELIFVVLKKDDLDNLGTMNQGRNSNGLPRKPKYMLDLRQIHKFEHYRLKFQ
jgi:hypothetical protein